MRKRQIARLIQAKEMGNSMNNSQTEILNILQEECAEVIQAVSKIRRFGEESNKLIGSSTMLYEVRCCFMGICTCQAIQFAAGAR